jgi:RNA polymerase sigma factor (sigma-70 family)
VLERERAELTRRARGELNGTVGRAVGVSDFVQSCFRSALRVFPSFRGRTRQSFHAWLTRIYENKFREALKFWRRGIRNPAQVEPLAIDPWMDYRLSGNPSSSDGMSQAPTDAEWLRIAISKLKPADQVLIQMKYYNKEKFHVIAESLGEKPATLRSQAARLVKKLAVGIPLLKMMHARRYPTLHQDAICLWFFQSLTENQVVERLGISRRLFRTLIKEVKASKSSRLQRGENLDHAASVSTAPRVKGES